MATLQKRNGNWRAIIRRKDFKPVSQTWDTKEEARAWAAEVEGQMRRGLIHHSDRGSQYASGDYVNLLKSHGINAPWRASSAA